MSPTSFSFQQAAWRRLKKNKGAMFGLVVIILSVLLAMFAYFISPDSSPYANRIILEVARQKPGHQQMFLKLKKEKNVIDAGFFEQLLWGKEDKFYYVPISAFQKSRDSIIVQKFIDEGLSERQSYAIPQTDTQNPVVTKRFWFGTDTYGRDILSRLIVGVRVSLGVGLVTVIISLTIGLFLGSLAGYFRGRTDDIITWFMNVIWGIPTLLLVFAITLVLGKGFWQVFIAVGLTMWVSVARLVRGQVLNVRELEYVEAAKALGFSNTRIILRHIVPNIIGPVMVIAASNFASAIVIEAGLSFLGVGVQPPQPSWGLMVKENYNFIITQNPILALAPGFAIMLLVLAFNLMGNGLRDALNVKGKI
ncbi:MAG TPA: ABC transporter permease [Chitinophagaceae bacterium]|jgi:peptide/nickel transport system permease protein|nr:ABC transporter permease [Chitinophagaceae bacterium]